MCNSLKIKSPNIQIVLSLSKTHMQTVYKSNSSTYEVIHMKTGVSKFMPFLLLRGSQLQLFQLIILATCHKTCLLLCLEISLLGIIHRHLSMEAREVIFCYSWSHVTHAHLILYHSNIIIILNMLIDSFYAMASHSSTLAWKIPWMEDPGRLQSMASQRVGHDWATSLSLFTFVHWRRKWQPTPVFLPGESQGRGSLVGCHLWGHTELDMTEVT